ncbi:MAG: Dot/Icm secretion system protein IcmQ [Legionella sp.]|nr:Dot/Icm secretion system protein IcmQ [Legionella sp.]
MNDKLSNDQNNSVLKALNEAIAQGPWDKSNFLKMIGKNLIEIRDGFLNQLDPDNQSQLKTPSHIVNRIALRSGQQEVYISLYSADGTNLQSWERIVANLPKQMISRPIYADEEDIKAVLRLKENKQNEAYVAIYINQTDILPSSDKVLIDKLGKTLLNLKDKVLNNENISRFVHASGVYRLNYGRLIKL